MLSKNKKIKKEIDKRNFISKFNFVMASNNGNTFEKMNLPLK